MPITTRYPLLAALVCILNSAVQAADTDPDQLRRQTDLFAAASQSGEQAAMNRLLDDIVLFSGGSGSVDHDPKYDADDAVSAELRHMTEAFRDAGQRGDVEAMRRHLDDQVLFINEDGVVSGRQDFSGGAPAVPPKAVSSVLTVNNWLLHHSGDVAVASFVDEQAVRYVGQSLTFRFLCVESWIKRGEAWKLIASQTIPLHEDPPAANLPSQLIDDYVGAYTAAPGRTITISRTGNALTSTNGNKASTLVPEVRDVFITLGLPPGYARPRLFFRRDGEGRVTGYASNGLLFNKIASAPASPAPAQGALVLRDFVVHQAGDVAVTTFLHDRQTPYGAQVLQETYRSSETWMRRGGAWKMIASQGRRLPKDPLQTILPEGDMDSYMGVYAGPGFTVSIRREGHALSEAGSGEKPSTLVAAARDAFFTPGSPRTIILFQRDGHVSGYVKRRDERDLVFNRL
jgi:ketosteroid isomerase-like protein